MSIANTSRLAEDRTALEEQFLGSGLVQPGQSVAWQPRTATSVAELMTIAQKVKAARCKALLDTQSHVQFPFKAVASQ